MNDRSDSKADRQEREAHVDSLLARFRQQLGSYRYQPIVADEKDIRAAVLVPLYCWCDELHIVLTKRTNTVRTQQGHISFPGGGREHQDADLLATALRESEEEVGLDPRHVEILGRIDDFSTRDGAVLIAGFVGLIDPAFSPYPWRPAAAEVAEILEVSVPHLRDPKNLVVEAPRMLHGRMWPNETFLYREHRVFGATARALRHIFDLVFADQ